MGFTFRCVGRFYCFFGKHAWVLTGFSITSIVEFDEEVCEVESRGLALGD